MDSLDSQSQDIVVEAVATSMGANKSEIEFVRQEIVTRRRLQESSFQIFVVTQTTVQLTDYPEFGTNTTQLYNYLVDNFETAVSNGNFTRTIRELSSILGNSAFLFVSTQNVVITRPSLIFPPSASPSFAPSSSPGAVGLPRTQVAVTVAAVLCGVLLVAAALYRFIISYRMKLEEQEEGDEIKVKDTVIEILFPDEHPDVMKRKITFKDIQEIRDVEFEEKPDVYRIFFDSTE